MEIKEKAWVLVDRHKKVVAKKYRGKQYLSMVDEVLKGIKVTLYSSELKAEKARKRIDHFLPTVKAKTYMYETYGKESRRFWDILRVVAVDVTIKEVELL